MIQGSSKLKNYSLRWLFKPLRLAKFDSFWIWVCAIVAFFLWYRGVILLVFLSFLLDRTFLMILLPIFLCLLRNPSPLFIVLFWSPRGTIDSPVLPPRYQSLCCAHRPEGSVSLFFILSFLLVLFLWKSMVDYLFRSTLRSRSSRSSFWPSFFFIFFLKWAKSHFADLKVFRCYSPFLYFFILVPQGATHLHYEKSLQVFLLFLTGSFDTWEGRAHLLFLVFLFGFFFWAVLILSWLYLHALGIPSLLAVSEDTGLTFFFNLLIWASFLFLSSLCFFGLQAFWAYHFFSFFVAPSAYFFGLGCCEFLDLNSDLIKYFFFFKNLHIIFFKPLYIYIYIYNVNLYIYL